MSRLSVFAAHEDIHRARDSLADLAYEIAALPTTRVSSVARNDEERSFFNRPNVRATRRQQRIHASHRGTRAITTWAADVHICPLICPKYGFAAGPISSIFRQFTDLRDVQASDIEDNGLSQNSAVDYSAYPGDESGLLFGQPSGAAQV